MSKFMFTSVNGDVITTKEFESEYLFDVVEHFEQFLRGCGYHFKGTLDFVDDEVQSYTDDYDYNQYDLLGPWPFDKKTQVSPEGC